MFDKLLGMFTKNIVIDLGTANTLIYVKDEGVVLDEPSIVAISTKDKKKMSFGREAKKMLGKNPDLIDVIRPLQDGVIADFEVTELMLKYFIKKAQGHKFLVKPKVIVCIPSGITEVEKRAVKDSVLNSGAREVHLISEPVAAALGAGVPITEPQGNLVIDIGGGTTEIAVLSLSNIVTHNSIRIGGDKMNDAIVNYLRLKKKVFVGLLTAEEIKQKVGSALKMEDELEMTVKGRDLVSGLPIKFKVTSNMVQEALADNVQKIVSAVLQLFEMTPAELTADIAENGVFLTGGGALLKNLDAKLRQETNLPIHLVPEPLTCVVRGTGKVMENFAEYAVVLI